jgi:hypothetical protein
MEQAEIDVIDSRNLHKIIAARLICRQRGFRGPAEVDVIDSRNLHKIIAARLVCRRRGFRGPAEVDVIDLRNLHKVIAAGRETFGSKDCRSSSQSYCCSPRLQAERFSGARAVDALHKVIAARLVCRQRNFRKQGL